MTLQPLDWCTRLPTLSARLAGTGAPLELPTPRSRLGVALPTLHLVPLHGLRTEPERGTSGWYLWGGGEMSDEDDFFSPLCLEHLAEALGPAVALLGLPPGWRFLIAPDWVDVWPDPALLGGG